MKEKFEDHISKIAEFPEYLRENHLDTTNLVQEEEKIKSLTKHLRDQLELLDFELFNKIMGGKEYNTHIYYDIDTCPDESDFTEWERLEVPIPELKHFFENPEYTSEEKKAVEEIIIFGLFLQATRDYCTSSDFLRYFELLDNLSYKCNPTAYKLLSSLSHIALCLVLSSLIIIPLAVLVLSWPAWPVLAGIALAGIILVTAFLFILPTFGFVSSIWNRTADKLWGTHWAYPLPTYATDDSPKFRGMHPYAVGIFPSILGRPAIPAGSSFKAMNRLGFFPFKEIADETIDMVTDGGQVSVNLPSNFRFE